MRTFITSCLVFGLSFSFAIASETITLGTLHNTDTGCDTSCNDQGSGFDTTVGGTLSQIGIIAKLNNSPTDDLTVCIKADGGTHYTGSCLATGTINSGLLTGSLASYLLTLDTPLLLLPTTRYWVVFGRSGSADLTNYYRIAYYNGGSSYTNLWSRLVAVYTDEGTLEFYALLNLTSGTMGSTGTSTCGNSSSSPCYVSPDYNINFGLMIIIGILSIAFTAYIFNAFTSKKKVWQR